MLKEVNTHVLILFLFQTNLSIFQCLGSLLVIILVMLVSRAASLITKFVDTRESCPEPNKKPTLNIRWTSRGYRMVLVNLHVTSDGIHIEHMGAQ